MTTSKWPHRGATDEEKVAINRFIAVKNLNEQQADQVREVIEAMVAATKKSRRQVLDALYDAIP